MNQINWGNFYEEGGFHSSADQSAKVTITVKERNFIKDICIEGNYAISTKTIRKFFILKTAEQNAPGNGADVLPDETWAYGDTIWLDWSEENDITADNYKVNNFPFSRKGEGTDPNDMAADFAWSDQIYFASHFQPVGFLHNLVDLAER